MGMNMSTFLGQALVLGNQVVRFLPWRCLYPWVLGFLTGSCYNGCMMLSECGCSHNEGRCIKDASIGLGFQVALFLPWLRQHGSTRHRGANVGLGIQMVFFVCFCWCFLAMVYAKARTYRYTGHCSNDIVTKCGPAALPACMLYANMFAEHQGHTLLCSGLFCCCRYRHVSTEAMMICLRQPGGYQYSGSMGNHKYMEVHPRQQSGSGPAALKHACSTRMSTGQIAVWKWQNNLPSSSL